MLIFLRRGTSQRFKLNGFRCFFRRAGDLAAEAMRVFRTYGALLRDMLREHPVGFPFINVRSQAFGKLDKHVAIERPIGEVFQKLVLIFKRGCHMAIVSHAEVVGDGFRHRVRRFSLHAGIHCSHHPHIGVLGFKPQLNFVLTG